MPEESLNNKFDVVDMVSKPGRFVIVDKETGEVVDDAQGWGYKDKNKAYKAAWYKFGKGKAKVDEAVAWWKEHPDFQDDVEEMLFIRTKEGEPTGYTDVADIIYNAAQAKGLTDYKKEFFKRL